jgi:hypothetical protein
MSNTDSFIDEVTEEVRRDKLYGYLRRYGWIAALVVVLIVAGAAWTEWRKAQAEAQAQALGNGIIDALSRDGAEARAQAITEVSADDGEARAVLDMIAASELAAAGETEAAADRLNAVALNGDIPEIYRQIAGFKELLVRAPLMDLQARRAGLQGFAAPGNPLRLLAEEQLALIDAEAGETDAAIGQLQSLLNDAEASADLQQRARQLIVALGGEPERAGPSLMQN